MFGVFLQLSWSRAHRFRHGRIRQHRLSHHLNRQAEAHRVDDGRNQITCVRAQDMPAEDFAIRIRQEFYAAEGLMIGDSAIEFVKIHTAHAVLILASCKSASARQLGRVQGR